uniref:Uncharacterized protein n=1 Tax=Arion vulgaris TaxID=1028688 RepID=A0A0B6Y9D7_9EUPU
MSLITFKTSLNKKLAVYLTILCQRIMATPDAGENYIINNTREDSSQKLCTKVKTGKQTSFTDVSDTKTMYRDVSTKMTLSSNR